LVNVCLGLKLVLGLHIKFLELLLSLKLLRLLLLDLELLGILRLEILLLGSDNLLLGLRLLLLRQKVIWVE